jgi:hypothetical protein
LWIYRVRATSPPLKPFENVRLVHLLGRDTNIGPSGFVLAMSGSSDPNCGSTNTPLPKNRFD